MSQYNAYKQTRISSLTTVLIAILHWIWPPDRCTNCQSIYSSPHLENIDGSRGSVGHIHRSVDGRFILVDGGGGGTNGGGGSGTKTFKRSSKAALTNGESIDGIDEVDGDETAIEPRRSSHASQNSSSDDGGFLSRRSFTNARASWRRPLVASPSQLSLQSAAGSARGLLQGLGGLLRFGGGGHNNNNADVANENTTRYQNVYRNHYEQDVYRNLQAAPPTSHPLHINTAGGTGVGGGMGHQHYSHHHHPHLVTPHLYTPSRVSRIFSSSPASTPNGGLNNNNDHHTGLLTSPWALTTPSNLHHSHFSDLSTVYPSSAERSTFPTPLTGGGGASFGRYRYYSHELPSLRTIQEETRRLNHGFVPLQIPSPPSWRGYPYHSQTPYHSYRPRTRWYPRHYSRLFSRSQSELLSPLPHLNLSLRSSSGMGIGGSGAMGLEASPESRSSSSGFGSKNTSNQPHGSHHSGSTSEWRLLPPYRPPPPPPQTSTTIPSSVTGTSSQLNSAYFGSQPTPQLAQAQAPVQQHHSYNHQLNSTLPPYYQHHTNPPHSYYSTASSLPRPSTPPYTMGHWLDMISRLNAATDNVHVQKSVDVGSVDGHYEFDPSTPTPSVSTPTPGGLRDELNIHLDTFSGHHHHSLGPVGGSIFHTSASGMPVSGSATLGGGPLRKARISRYENIEARLQAMKEEFYAYRKRQAMQRAEVGELESVC